MTPICKTGKSVTRPANDDKLAGVKLARHVEGDIFELGDGSLIEITNREFTGIQRKEIQVTARFAVYHALVILSLFLVAVLIPSHWPALAGLFYGAVLIGKLVVKVID